MPARAYISTRGELPSASNSHYSSKKYSANHSERYQSQRTDTPRKNHH